MKNLIFLIVLIGILVLIVKCSNGYRNELEAKGIWGKAIITGTRPIRNLRIVYIFNNNEYVTGNTPIENSKILLLKNTPLPVLYLKEDEASNELLFLKEDFADFKKPYPDSLKWICDSLQICK